MVCVVGEFKQGKSSLVNALVRTDVCPVDDDLATSVITLVQHGETAGAVVRRKEEGKPVAEAIAIGDVGAWASEQGNPDNQKGVERVDITVPSKLLKEGVMLVDTPGMGGLGGGHAAATMAFLPFADGLVLVTDASSELTAPEIDFLKKATELCPTVMLALTKIDLYPRWEQIAKLNRAHLDRLGLDIATVAVSSTLRSTALAERKKDLNVRSNFPELVNTLQKQVIAPARQLATQRTATELSGVARLLRTGAEEERRLLEHPEELQASLDALAEATARLEHLRGPGAKWSQVLGDRIADMSTEVSHDYRAAMRRIGRQMDETVEQLTRGCDWEATTRDAQTHVSEATARAFGSIQTGRNEIRAQIIETLQADDAVVLGDDDHVIRARTEDLSDFWAGTEALQEDENVGLAGVRSVMGVGQSYGSSKMLFTNLGGISKFGVSLGALAAGPVLAGGFVVMGGMKLFDDRKKRLTTRRQKTRTQIRAFIDNVQFDVSTEISTMVRDVSRELRDEFVARIAELQTTYNETAQRAKKDASKGKEEVDQRKARLDAALAELTDVDTALTAMTNA